MKRVLTIHKYIKPEIKYISEEDLDGKVRDRKDQKTAKAN